MTKTHFLNVVIVIAISLAGMSIACGNAPVLNLQSLTITPRTAGVGPGGTVQFSAATSGSASGIVWSVNGTVGGSATAGTITADGQYTAPQGASPALVSINATIGSDVNSSGVATVEIVPTGTVTATPNPQVASYSLSVPGSSTVHVEFGPDTNYGLDTSTQQTSVTGSQVKFWVAGMRAFTAYHMRAVVQFPDGTIFDDADHVFTTQGASPGQIPALTAATTAGMTPQGGVELVDLVGSSQERVVVTDLSGNVIWFFDIGSPALIPNPAKLLPDGNFLINYSEGTVDGLGSILEEVDLAGNVVWQMTAADLNTALAAAGYDITVVGTHHDVAALPNGHLVVIASTNKDFTNLTGYPGTTTVSGDVLIDLDTNRKPVWVWSEFDHLDVNRHPMEFPDWTHTNAILYSPDDGNLIISVRHQHWVIKIDYEDGSGSGDIIWKLGWQGDFKLVGGTDPFDWFYAQHGPSFASSNTSGVFDMVIFDNGNGRPKSDGTPCGFGPGSPCYSTVPLLQIDENAKTATIQWRETLSVFSFFGGNAEVLANGNVEFDECASSTGTASVYEVTQDPQNPQVVWQLQVTGHNAYRAFRIPSLYPGVQW